MKRLLLGMSMVAAMLLVSSSAFAGVNLRWTDCFGDGGAADRVSACASNTGTNILVMSFDVPSNVTQASGLECVVDFVSQTAAMPAWWDFKNTGACRQLSLGINFSPSPLAVNCVDWSNGQGAGGLGSYDTKSGTIDTTGTVIVGNQHRRLSIAIAVPPAALADLFTATEYFAANLTINNQKTVGTGSCAGCTTPVCIVLNSVKVTTPNPINDITVGSPSVAGSNVASWQGGPGAAICNAVPTRNATWGQVKSLYR